MNEQYRTNLTIQDLWECVVQNVHFEDLEHSTKAVTWETLNLFKPLNCFVSEIKYYASGWLSSLFTLPLYLDPKNFEKVDRHGSKSKNVEGLPGQLHPGTIIGGLEMLAGGAVLLCFGGTVAGGVLGAGLIGDGIRRIADDGQTDFESSLRNRYPINRTTR